MPRTSTHNGFVGGITAMLFGSTAIAVKGASDSAGILNYVDPLIGTATGGWFESRSYLLPPVRFDNCW